MIRTVRPALMLAVCLGLGVPPVRAAVSVPSVFSDHMVLQRNADVPIWGRADAGEAVAVTLEGRTVRTRAGSDGRWRVDLPTGEAGGPYVLTVAGEGADDTIEIRDVLVGEVWLCAGQSNMAWVLERARDAEAEIAAADWPRIRHLKVPQRAASQPQEDQAGTWEVCSPRTASQFTAVGYFFARKLHRALDVPIGLLNVTWGGTRIEPWTPAEGFALVDSLGPIHERVLLQDASTEAHARRAGEYLDSVDDWLTRARAAVSAKKSIEPAPALPSELAPFSTRGQPSALYNGMTRAVVPYRIRGAIWYQGEGNRMDDDYTEKSLALVRGWRRVWQADLPFYFVQIAPFHYSDLPPHAIPELWEQQARVERQLEDSAMVVVNDIGDVANIHPANKQDVGLRLANVALKRTYGVAGIADSGPRFKSLDARGDALRVTFAHADGGLRSRDGAPLTHFEVVGPGTGWRDAEATIDGDAVVLRAAGVKHPTAVRFAWHKTAVHNLMNGAGLPASPFRAGDVPDDGPLVLDVAEARGYRLVYDLDLHKLGKAIRYDRDEHADAGAFDRVAYFLELKKPGEPLRWLYVSMDAFTDDAGKIGIPTVASGAHFQQAVKNLHVVTNSKRLPVRNGVEGNIEFWPNNYSAANSDRVEGASATLYDFGDAPASSTVDGYGSMQVHLTPVKTTLFAINRWSHGDAADLGMGNSDSERAPDWTFVNNAGDYEVKRLRVLVRPAQQP